MVRGSAGSDSEEERHDRFRSERNNTALKSSTSLYSSGLDNHKKMVSLSRLDSPVRRRDRSRERRRSRSRERRRSREKRDDKKRTERHRSPNKHEITSYYNMKYNDDRSRSRHSEEKRSKRSHERRSRSRHSDELRRNQRSRERSDEMHKNRDKNHKHRERSPRIDTFVAGKFERNRSSDGEERIEKTTVYLDHTPSPDRDPKKHKKRSKDDKKKSKDKKKKKDDKLESDNPDLEEAEHSQIELRKEYKDSVNLEKKRSQTNLENEKKKRKKKDISPKKVNKIKKKDEIQLTQVDEITSTHVQESKSPSIEPKIVESNTKNPSTKEMPILEEIEDEDTYGPVLPEQKDEMKDPAPTSETSLEEGELVTTPVKPVKIYGPTLPERMDTGPIPEDSEDEDLYGPALPPTLKTDDNPVEQTIPDDDDEPGFGPLPQGVDGGTALIDLERRAAIIKAQLENKECEEDVNITKREEWMTELPDASRIAMGLGARKFRAKEGPDMSDRTSWSDTPAQKEQKKLLAPFAGEEINEDETRRLEIALRDKEMEKQAKKGKKRDKSLLELHQKDIKKKKKKEDKERGSKKEERRPFSRDVDLQANRFDEAQKKSIIKKAQLLNTRFSTGESKYL